jgi:Histidine kinase-, DNA gyrase B-, and HSP90-like ATPase
VQLLTELTEQQRGQLEAAWRAATAIVEPLLGGWQDDLVSVRRSEYTDVLGELATRAPDLYACMESWSWDATRVHLERLGEQARSLATRLLRADLRVDVEVDSTRSPPELSPFWSSSVHLIRNAIDHGIEEPEQRRAAGKSEGGRLRLRGRADGSSLLVEIEDDGRGIDWNQVKDKAVKLGLPAAEQHDLERALFADGLSTRNQATELSGRGVGMAAVLASCESLGGSVEVRSQHGMGTCVRVRLPFARQQLAI